MQNRNPALNLNDFKSSPIIENIGPNQPKGLSQAGKLLKLGLQ